MILLDLNQNTLNMRNKHTHKKSPNRFKTRVQKHKLYRESKQFETDVINSFEIKELEEDLTKLTTELSELFKNYYGIDVNELPEDEEQIEEYLKNIVSARRNTFWSDFMKFLIVLAICFGIYFVLF